MHFPSTLLEFQAQFPDEESCWAYLRRSRWLADSGVLAAESGAVTSSRRGGSSNAAAAAIKAR